MAIVAEFAIPPDSIPGGETLIDLPHATIQLERIIPTGDSVFPFFWVFNADPETFLEHAHSEADIAEVQLLAEFEHAALYNATWRPKAGVIEGIKTLEATILDASGTVDGWTFQVRALDRERLAAFQRIFANQGIPVRVQRIYNFDELVACERGLTEEQRETLLVAQREGYFDHPRRITQAELGERFGITGRAVSGRLRRGINNLIRSTLLNPDGGDRP